MPEVLTAIKTKQLAQELLLYKEDHLQDIAKTGAAGFVGGWGFGVLCRCHWVLGLGCGF